MDESMPRVYTISDHNRWRQMNDHYHGEVRHWLYMHGISSIDIPVEWPLTVECGTGENWFIHYYAYRRDDVGLRRTDARGEPLVDERYVPMEIDPPMYWFD
jgi:hypothetical protein